MQGQKVNCYLCDAIPAGEPLLTVLSYVSGVFFAPDAFPNMLGR
jgi:hypothetical protein